MVLATGNILFFPRQVPKRCLHSFALVLDMTAQTSAGRSRPSLLVQLEWMRLPIPYVSH
jgi:hypothetical protein